MTNASRRGGLLVATVAMPLLLLGAIARWGLEVAVISSFLLLYAAVLVASVLDSILIRRSCAPGQRLRFLVGSWALGVVAHFVISTLVFFPEPEAAPLGSRPEDPDGFAATIGQLGAVLAWFLTVPLAPWTALATYAAITLVTRWRA